MLGVILRNVFFYNTATKKGWQKNGMVPFLYIKAFFTCWWKFVLGIHLNTKKLIKDIACYISFIYFLQRHQLISYFAQNHSVAEDGQSHGIAFYCCFPALLCRRWYSFSLQEKEKKKYQELFWTQALQSKEKKKAVFVSLPDWCD